MTPDVIDLPPAPSARLETLADVLHHLGDLPADRVFSRPYPATEADVLRFRERHPKRLVELVDGFLVEKAMGYREGLLAVWIGTLLNNFVVPRRLGIVGGADAIMRLAPGLNRLPDVHFKAWATLPSPDAHNQAVAAFAPDLAVEVLSEKNTRREIDRKQQEYFAAGVPLMWVVDPHNLTVSVYTTFDTLKTFTTADILTGEPVLPEFRVAVADIFAYLERPLN